MKQHTTNYVNTFIEMADDCPAMSAKAPPCKDEKTAARIEYEMLIDHPYQYTSDDVLYAAHGKRKGLSREAFFSKGQPCFRASALTKRYGWGVHSNADSRVAIFPVESDEYKSLAADPSIKHVKAMSSRKKA